MVLFDYSSLQDALKGMYSTDREITEFSFRKIFLFNNHYFLLKFWEMKKNLLGLGPVIYFQID